MAGVRIVLKGFPLIQYARRGREAVQAVRRAIGKALNAGRTAARQRIGSEFGVRTGVLRKQARGMRTRVTVSRSEVSGKVGPVPRLMNIFEHGAVLAQGRGFLRPRPVVGPAGETMKNKAEQEIAAVLDGVMR